MSARTCVQTAAVLLLVGAAAACPPPKPVVTEMELVPSTVAVASDAMHPTTFVLEARLWSGLPTKRVRILESDGVKLAWSVSPAGAGVELLGSPTGFSATVRVDPGTNPASEVTVQIEAGGLGAKTRIVPSVTSGDDLVETATYADDQAPDAVIARGIRTSADNPCGVWLPPALERTGIAGAVTANCSAGPDWAVAVLDSRHAMGMYRMAWTTGVDKVPSGTPLDMRVIPVAVRVFIGGPGDLTGRQNGARSFADAEIQDANSVLAENRAGIQLHQESMETVPNSPPDEVTVVSSCAMGDDLTQSHDYASPAPMLHIYIVDDIGGGNGFVGGFACPATNTRPQPVIYLKEGGSGTILLHEVGHALGLTFPGTGHSDYLMGFDPANVMASGYADSDRVWRRLLTVGQVLRMNADDASWLNWAKDPSGNMLRDAGAPRVQCQCGADDPAGECPRQRDDVARPRGGLQRLFEWECSDLIKLPELEPDERPLALLAGRPWRTAPTDCRRDIAGHFYTHDNAEYIQSENLTRAGSCPSWLAVFFQHHRPIFRDLESVEGIWSDSHDLRILGGTLDAPAVVNVFVYYDPVNEGEAKAGISEAEQVYGEANRTGLDVHFTGKALAGSCPTAPPGDYAICYSIGGSSVAQLLGTALGLPALTTSDASQAAYANNAMQTSSGVHDKLTLGQLFRIHSKLGTAGFPADCASAPCPPLDSDVKP